MIKKIGIGIVAVLIIIQFVPSSSEPTPVDEKMHIEKLEEIQPEVLSILKNSCYDCHSNETDYPWYASVAPVSFLINHDINEGREELNFSNWGAYNAKRRNHKLEEIAEEVEEGEMPLEIYTVMHGDAKLAPAQRELIEDWAKGLMTEEAE